MDAGPLVSERQRNMENVGEGGRSELLSCSILGWTPEGVARWLDCVHSHDLLIFRASL